MKNHPAALHGSGCLILGYGRCAKVLAEKLKGLSAEVTVCCRSEQQRAAAQASGAYCRTVGAPSKNHTGENIYL